MMAMELSSQELSMAKIRFFIAALVSLEFSVNFSQKSQILRDKARFYEKFDLFKAGFAWHPHKQKMLNLWIVALAKLAHNDGISRNFTKHSHTL